MNFLLGLPRFFGTCFMARSFFIIAFLSANLLVPKQAQAKASVTPLSAPALIAKIQDAAKKTGAVGLINVWATWCEPCVDEFPELIALYKDYQKQGLKLWLVSGNFLDEEKLVLDFLEKQGVDFEVYMIAGKSGPFIEEFKKAFGSDWGGSMPVTYIIDREGKNVFYSDDTVTYDQLKAALVKKPVAFKEVKSSFKKKPKTKQP